MNPSNAAASLITQVRGKDGKETGGTSLGAGERHSKKADGSV